MKSEILPKLVLHAPNVHQGGGKSLLVALLAAVPGNVKLQMQLDSRMTPPANLSENMTVKCVAPSVIKRLLAEWWLAQNAQPQDTIVCFGNLPPFFKLAGRTLVFVQNRYLIDGVRLDNFPLKTRLRLKVERFWFYWKAVNANAFVVQTPSMRAILESSGAVTGKPIYVLPFVGNSDGYQRSLNHESLKGLNKPLIYVASGEPHKNHRKLIEAWCLLAKDGLFPTLWLTVDVKSNTDLCVWMEQQKRLFGLQLENLGAQPHEQIKHLYTQVQALIYPSTFESFGLPLIEARQAGLAVVASELDFVRDVIDPEEVFDPQSPVSISRAVKRFMGLDEKALPLLNAAEFLKNVLEKCK